MFYYLQYCAQLVSIRKHAQVLDALLKGGWAEKTGIAKLEVIV